YLLVSPWHSIIVATSASVLRWRPTLGGMDGGVVSAGTNRASSFGRGESRGQRAGADFAVPYPAAALKTTSPNTRNVITCTQVHHRKRALGGNSPVKIRYSRNTMPTIPEPTRAQLTGGHVARHAHGEVTAAMKTTKASPSTATGKMPNTTDSGLVVTAAQLTSPLSEHARIDDEV